MKENYNDLIGRIWGFIVRFDLTREDEQMLMECVDALYEMQEHIRRQEKAEV
jgi:hypothetical protein